MSKADSSESDLAEVEPDYSVRSQSVEDLVNTTQDDDDIFTDMSQEEVDNIFSPGIQVNTSHDTPGDEDSASRDGTYSLQFSPHNTQQPCDVLSGGKKIIPG